MIHLGLRRQAVRAELVHNAAPGILRDSHSSPCVAVGQVPQQPRPILLTYRYWFLFLGLRIVSFLMPLIQRVYCATCPAVARAGEVRNYSRRIAYIPANSNHINNFFRIKDKRTLSQEMLEMLSFCINTSKASSEEICFHTH